RSLDRSANAPTLDLDHNVDLVPRTGLRRPPALETVKIPVSGHSLVGRANIQAKKNQQDRHRYFHDLTLSPCREAIPSRCDSRACRLPNPAGGEKKRFAKLPREDGQQADGNGCAASAIGQMIQTISRLRENLLARSLLSTRILGGDPGVELGLKLLDPLGMGRGQVAPFGGVHGEVVEFGFAP